MVDKLSISAAVLILVASECLAGTKVSFKTTYDYLMAPQYFKCEVSEKRILRKKDNSASVCMTHVQCDPIKHQNILKSSSPILSCDIVNGVCQDLFPCAKSAAVNKANHTNVEWQKVEVASTATHANNPHNDLCVYDGKHAEASTYSFHENGVAVEKYCVASYTCKKNPSHKLVACDVRVENNKDVCPQVNDCITEAKPLVPGYTQSELNGMSASQRAAALKEMEDGPEDLTTVSTSIHAPPVTAEAEVHP